MTFANSDRMASSAHEERPAIIHYTGLNRTPVLSLAVRGWLALIESGHCSNTIQIAAEHNAFGAVISDQVVGVLTYRHVPALKELAIGIGYVVPEFRRHGIYDHLWEALVIKARELDSVHISSATFLGNTAMRSVARAQGRVESQVVLNFDL